MTHNVFGGMLNLAQSNPVNSAVITVGMFQSIIKTIKLDALPDGGRKLHDEVMFLSENLRQLDIHINNRKTAQTGTGTGIY